MSSRSRLLAAALLFASIIAIAAPAGGQEAPVEADADGEKSPCAPPEPEPTPDAAPDSAAPDPAAPADPEPAPVEVERPPELAFVNGKCIPIAQLSRMLADYEGSVAEEAAALVELREQLEALDQLNEQLDATEVALAEVVVRDAAAEAEARYAEMREDIAGQELDVVQLELAAQQELLRDQAVAAYVGGGDPSLTVEAAVLGAKDLNSLGSTRAYGGVIVDNQVGQVELVEVLEAAATDLEAELVQARQHAIDVEDDVAAVRAIAVELRNQQSRLVDEAEAGTEVQAELVATIQQRRDQYAGQLGFATTSGGSLGTVLSALGEGTASLADVNALSSPLAGTSVSSGFGPRVHPIFSEVRMHTGLDLNATAGTPIFAVADGRVVVAGEEGGYGLAVAIDHGNGIATLYAHQSAFAVSVGDEVVAGDVIGFIGSTGFSTGPHLHFELRLDGNPVDPFPFVDLRPESVPSESAIESGG